MRLQVFSILLLSIGFSAFAATPTVVTRPAKMTAIHHTLTYEAAVDGNVVTMEIPAADATLVKEAGAGMFVSPYFKRPMRLKVFNVSTNVDAETKGVRADFIPTNSLDTAQLHGKVKGTVTLQTKATKAFVVPETAIETNEGKTFLKIAEQGVVRKIEVQIGSRTQGFATVTTGLREGQAVIESTGVRDGDKVTTQTAQ